MKTITRKLKVDLTVITKVEDENMIISKADAKKNLELALRHSGFDDVKVTKVQDFVWEEEDHENTAGNPGEP